MRELLTDLSHASASIFGFKKLQYLTPTNYLSLNIEAIRQIRGECDARQIKDARHIQYIAPGPVSTSIIYSSEKHR
jgi:hypothetical protein